MRALGVLSQEHHQKGHNGGHGNKGKVPVITKVKERACHCPDHDKAQGGGEREEMAREAFSLLRHTIKTIKN